MFLGSLTKKAFNIEYQQRPEVVQKTQVPTAVIIKGNPAYIENNKHADKFYNDLAALVRAKGYAVSFDPGAPHTVPGPADVWIGHSRGNDRLRFAPKQTKTIAMGLHGTPDAITHPLDRSAVQGDEPTVFHYLLTKEMRDQLLSRL